MDQELSYNDSGENMITIKFASHIKIPIAHKLCDVGRIDIQQFNDSTKIGHVIPVSADTEFYFYKLFIKLMNVQLDYDLELAARKGNSLNIPRNKPSELLSKGDIDYLALFMCKPLNFTLTYSTKSNEFDELGSELSRTATSAKNAFVRIRNAGYIYKNEDKIWTLCDELQYLRQLIKLQIQEKGFALFSYVFNSVVKN